MVLPEQVESAGLQVAVVIDEEEAEFFNEGFDEEEVFKEDMEIT